MAKIPRITNKIFGETATATGSDPEIGQFGSALAGTYNGTTDVATIQSLNAWSNGFIGAVTASNQYPALPEMTGFGKVLSQQTGYLYQTGIPEWDSGTTYYTNSFCQVNGYIYRCDNDNVIGTSPTTDTTNWTNLGRTFLNQNQVTNCILKDPQNINLTLSGGTLTLEAGSVVCVPNGFESDGTTPKFDEVTITSDISTTYAANIQIGFYVSNNGTGSGINPWAAFNSGATDTGSGSHVWYDTVNNKIRRYNGSTLLEDNCSFPVCIYSGNTSITSIDQIFQSIGYIGSTVFVRKGLKVLIPNGRNTDGSLKNIEYTLSSTITYTDSDTNYNLGIALLNNATVFTWSQGSGAGKFHYNPINNAYYASNTFTQCICLGTCDRVSGVISNFKAHTAANLVEYNQLGSYILDMFYPVNSLYITVDTSSVCPIAKFGGTWQLVGQDRVLQGASSVSGAGGTKAAGLPNITGTISNNTYGVAWTGLTDWTGAFSGSGTGQHDTDGKGGADNNSTTITFNASSSNSIYGNSTTVQPPALLVNIWQRTA